MYFIWRVKPYNRMTWWSTKYELHALLSNSSLTNRHAILTTDIREVQQLKLARVHLRVRVATCSRTRPTNFLFSKMEAQLVDVFINIYPKYLSWQNNFDTILKSSMSSFYWVVINICRTFPRRSIYKNIVCF